MEQVPERGDSSGQYGLGEKLRGIFDGQEKLRLTLLTFSRLNWRK